MNETNRARPEDELREFSSASNLSRQQRHHGGRSRGGRGDDALPHRRVLQPELDVRGGARPCRRHRPRPAHDRQTARQRPSPEILFTSCATESNNTAIFGTIAANPEPPPHHHHRRRAPRRVRSRQGPRATRLRESTSCRSTPRGASTRRSSCAPCARTRCWFRSCTPTTRPA